jgi:hypothetical protein
MADPPSITTEERTPAEILEEHSRESISRINKIDAWVKRVSSLLLGLAVITLLTVVAMGFAFKYLVEQIADSRWETAVKGCQINRKAAHDANLNLLVGISRTDRMKIKSQRLADQYFEYDREGCEKYAEDIGLSP